MTIVTTLPAPAPATPGGGATSTPSKELPEDEWSPVEREAPKPVDPGPLIPFKRRDPNVEQNERVWKEAQEVLKGERKKEAEARGRGHGQSFNDWFYKKIDSGVEEVAKKFRIPEKLRPLLKQAVRAGLEKGTAAAIDGVLNQTGLSDNEKEAVRKAIEEAIKTKPPVKPK